MFVEVGRKSFEFGKGAFIMLLLVAALAVNICAHEGWLTAAGVDAHSGDGVSRPALEILRLFNEELRKGGLETGVAELEFLHRLNNKIMIKISSVLK